MFTWSWIVQISSIYGHIYRSVRCLIKLLNDPQNIALIESMLCYPNFLDNLLLMDYHYRAQSGDKSLFEKELNNIIQNAHTKYQNVFSNLKHGSIE